MQKGTKRDLRGLNTDYISCQFTRVVEAKMMHFRLHCQPSHFECISERPDDGFLRRRCVLSKTISWGSLCRWRKDSLVRLMQGVLITRNVVVLYFTHAHRAMIVMLYRLLSILRKWCLYAWSSSHNRASLLLVIKLLVAITNLKPKWVELCFQLSEPLELVGRAAELVIQVLSVSVDSCLTCLWSVKQSDGYQMVLYRILKTLAQCIGLIRFSLISIRAKGYNLRLRSI